MKLHILMFFGVVFSAYGIINFYIGHRGWQAFGRQAPTGTNAIYWSVFWLFALSYLVGRFGENSFPDILYRPIAYIGSFWLAIMFYLLLALLLLDCVRALNAAWHFLPTQVTQRPELIGICIASFCIGVVTYGTWNAWHPRTRHFDITIHKSASTLHQLHIVMASDIHLGEIVNRKRLERLVHDINNLHPDIVLLPGDTIDENVRPFQEQHMAEVLRGIKARYGTYAVLGNHEYLGEQVNEALRALANANVIVLRDQYVKIANSFYLLGRDDRSCPRFTGKGRQPFDQLMKGIDKHLPILLMDHQPYDLEESASAGVDLQLSGHTHHGQIFPNGLLTQKIFEVDWGYLQKGAYQVIVSCGYGTWGPPIRTGNTPELLDIMVHFLPAQEAHQSSISR